MSTSDRGEVEVVVSGQETAGRGPSGTVPVFYVSDGTGLSAEAMGESLLSQFPDVRFERTVLPFVGTVEEARRAVAVLDAAVDGPATPLVFLTIAADAVRLEVHTSRCPVIDFFELHVQRVESILDARGLRRAQPRHGLADPQRYARRMAAVDYAVEHDDGRSTHALERAEVVLVAPSGCGKTPLATYLAVQHGVFVANVPLTGDGPAGALPPAVSAAGGRTIGLLSSPTRLATVRHERRPGSRYASLDQCAAELAAAEQLFRDHDLTVLDTSSRSVEEVGAEVRRLLASRP